MGKLVQMNWWSSCVVQSKKFTMLLNALHGNAKAAGIGETAATTEATKARAKANALAGTETVSAVMRTEKAAKVGARGAARAVVENDCHAKRSCHCLMQFFLILLFLLFVQSHIPNGITLFCK